MKLIYCYDAYCGWCYGFQPVMKKLRAKYKDDLEFEILSGGMMLPEQPVHISVTADVIKASYPRVEEMTGVKFGEDYLWHIYNPDLSDWFPSSEKPAVALAIIKELNNELAFDFAADLQVSLFSEGRDLTDDEAYRHLLEKYHVDVEFFYESLHSDRYKEMAHLEFDIVKRLQVKGFPAVLLQVSMDKFYLMSSGYLDFDSLDSRFQNVFAELNN